MSIEIQSVMHVNVNCSNLARSLRFYQDGIGLKSESHTNPLPQDGAGFGMDGQVQWDAHILHDDRGFAGPGLDLLEWKCPEPWGTPYASCNHLGFSRIGFGVPDIDVAVQRVDAVGGACLSAPVKDRADSRDEDPSTVVRCADPDGTIVELIERPELGQSRLGHATVNCSDLSRATEWYERVLGMEVRGDSASGTIPGDGFGLPDDEIEWAGRSLLPPGQDAFAIELVEWIRPAPIGAPYASANHLGIYRMAFMVADMSACHAELLEQGVECPPPVYLDMGPEIPIDGLWAIFFPDSDGTCMELIETPSLDGVDSGS